MKIKQLKWKKGYSDDPEKTFWYEAQFKPPFEYCVEPNIDGNKWSAWNTSADGSDKKLGEASTKQGAKEICQAHFQKQIGKFLC